MIRYKKYKNTIPDSSCFGKFYGRATHETVTFEEFITHMAKHHCVFSEGTIRGVLVEMEVCLRELLLEGKAVYFDELGIFRIGLETQGRNTAAEFTADDIKAVHMCLYLGKRFRARQLFADAKFKEADIYTGFDNTNGGETATTEGDDEGPSNTPDPTNTNSGGTTPSNNGGGFDAGDGFFSGDDH